MSDEITHGSGNVFADLGMADAAERQTKTRLAMEINDLLKAKKLNQMDTAALLGIPQPKVAELARYRLDGFSVESSARNFIPVEEAAKEWRKNPEFVAAYDALEEEFSLADALIKARAAVPER